MNRSSHLANSNNTPLSSSSTSLPSPSPSHEPQRVKMVILGDDQVGKSSLAISYTTRTFPQLKTSSPSNKQTGKTKAGPFADYYTSVTLDDKDFELSVWDTNASSEYEHIRPLNFAKTDIFLLCFSLIDATTLEHITKWSREVTNNFPAGKEPPRLLVGLKSDLKLEPLPFDKQKRATREQALQVAKEIGAVDYVECSARSGDGVEDVFLTALNAVVYPCLQSNDNINIRGSGGANVEEEIKDVIVQAAQPNVPAGRKKRCIIS